MCVISDVVVVVVGAKYPWLLWSPPDWLLPQAVLVLVASQTCNAQNHVQSPLIQNTPSVALLCLNHNLHRANYTFSVLTHLPLNPNSELLSLGTWHPENFFTHGDIFHDRFQDFNRIAVYAIASTADKPAVFQRDDGKVDGFSVRMVDTMSSWLNFTSYYKTLPCKFKFTFCIL